MRLKGDVAHEPLARAGVHRRLQALGRDVRGGDVADLALADELVEGAERLLGRRHLVVAMRVEQVDVVGLQALQGLLGRRADVVGREPLAIGLRADLRGEHDRVAVAARRHPAPDDLLRLAAAVARHPLRVAVGGVDEVAAGVRVGVEHGEGLGLVGRPSEHVAAQAQRVHGEVGRGDVAHASNLPGRGGQARDGGGGGGAQVGEAQPAPLVVRTRRTAERRSGRPRRWSMPATSRKRSERTRCVGASSSSHSRRRSVTASSACGLAHVEVGRDHGHVLAVLQCRQQLAPQRAAHRLGQPRAGRARAPPWPRAGRPAAPCARCAPASARSARGRRRR